MQLQLDGRLQLLPMDSAWRFFPEPPDDNDLGVGKRGSLTERWVVELSRKIGARFFFENSLDKFKALNWQVFYDTDGKYVYMSDKSGKQILCFGGRPV